MSPRAATRIPWWNIHADRRKGSTLDCRRGKKRKREFRIACLCLCYTSYENIPGVSWAARSPKRWNHGEICHARWNFKLRGEMNHVMKNDEMFVKCFCFRSRPIASYNTELKLTLINKNWEISYRLLIGSLTIKLYM